LPTGTGIVNLPWFRETPIIVFLNKFDLFEKKIEKVDLGIYFPLYKGRKSEIVRTILLGD